MDVSPTVSVDKRHKRHRAAPGVVCLCYACVAAVRAAELLVFKMTELVLKKIAKHFGDAPWLAKENDYLVLDDAGRIIGRIVIRAHSPKGRPWVWTITAREQPPSFSNNQGYSENCEQAMEDFKAQYSVLRSIASHASLMRPLDGTF
jgi:hypothetical protein